MKNKIQDHYDRWSEQYDHDANKTRDMEKKALRTVLKSVKADNCLEAGCGTGKNTVFLAKICAHVVAFDLSEKMLEKARKKTKAENVKFIQGDLTGDIKLNKKFDLVAFSLVLEHIKNLNALFIKLKNITKKSARVYIAELHPFRQYKGSKARYELKGKTKYIPSFTHHISDYTEAARKAGFEIELLNEFFDGNDNTLTPRLLVVVFRKK